MAFVKRYFHFLSRIGYFFIIALLFSILLSSSYAAALDLERSYTTPKPENRPNELENFLLTPRSALEYFIENSKAKNFNKSSAVLHMALVKNEMSAEELAQKLWVIVDKQLMYDWDNIPDLPEAPIKSTSSESAQWSRSISLDKLKLGDKFITIYLQRFKTDNGNDIWLFSPQSVAQVPVIFEHYKPSGFQKHIPQWATERHIYLPLWQWFILPLLTIASIFVSVQLVNIIVSLSLRSNKKAINLMIEKLRRPLRFLIAIGTLKISIDLILSLTGPLLTITQAFWSAAIVLNIFWFFITFFNIFFDHLQDYYVRDSEGNLKEVDTLVEAKQKNKLTHISVLRRIAIFCAVLITTTVLLINFDLFDGLGAGILTSAGILSVLIGIAGQATFGNIIAGLQIVMTKPVRIGDTLFYKDEWCYCEDITYTYITLRVWDHRRMIVPLKEFISNSFENWSMKDSHILKPIYLHVDYTIDINIIRDKFVEILNEHRLYDHRFRPVVEAFSITEHCMCVRLLCSAANAIDAWNLHCEMREKMVKFLCMLEGGMYLPRIRQVNINEHKRAYLN